MDERPSAQILAFPGARAPVPPVQDPQERLQRALAALDAALGEQRAAVANWRNAIGDLQTTMGGLSNSLVNCHTSLDELGNRVATLNGDAVRLEQWADNALSGQSTAP